MRTIQYSLAMLLLAGGSAAAQERLAIKGGKVLPASGAPIENGVVLIRNGKIEAVGKDVVIPSDAKVIDATGKVVVPGFIEAHSNRGTDRPNETNPNVPFLSVVDSIDPNSDYFEECRRNGVTAVAVVPGNATMFGGQAAIVKTHGSIVDDMIVKRAAAIKISLRPMQDRNRMGHIAQIRKWLDDAKDAVAADNKADTKASSSAEEKPSDKSEPSATDTQPPRRGNRQGGNRGQRPGEAPDSALVTEALAKLLRGDLLAFIYCEQAMDVPQAIKLVNDYKLKGVLVLNEDCHKAISQIAAAKLPVVLDPNLVYWETDPRTGEDKQIVLPKIYREAGVPVNFQVTGFAAGNLFRAPNLPPTTGTNYLWYQAATAAKYGMPADEALQSITLRPAQTIGVGSQLGSIEPGKDADLVILTGDPLKLDTWVDKTIIGGRVVYERDQDRKLKALLKPEK
jgi:imidazolonepropionase-like amidohydrolase